MDTHVVEQGGPPKRQDLIARTRALTVRVIVRTEALPYDRETDDIARQLLRATMSGGAHYRMAKRAKSDRDFVNMIREAIQEWNESVGWMHRLAERGMVPAEDMQPLIKETSELIAMCTTMAKKVSARNPRRRRVE